MRNSAKQWPHIPLGELAEIERNAVSPENIKSGTKYVGLENMTSSGSFVGVAEVATGDLASTKFAFTDRHILYGKLRPYLAKIARPRFPGVCSTDILPILPGSKVDPGFLLHFLRQPRMVDYASSKTTGANLPRLSPKALAEFEIPLPPLSEQKRIADILDKADSIRRKRQETVTVAEGFVSALFMEMFASHHSAHSDTVKVMSFDDAISDFIDYRGKTPCKSTSGVPLVTAKVVKGGRILPPDEFIPDGDYDAWMRRGLPLRGDVLFTTEAPLGEVAQVADERIALAQRVLLMRGKKSVLNNTFLRLAIKTPFVWNQIQRRSTGSTVRGIRQKELRQVTLPVPSIAEQEQFERIAQRQEQSIEVLRTSATHAELLFNSLVQCAFKGEL
jgi:type I restriction enzyme S subunit